MKRFLTTIIVLSALGAAGYFGYTYIDESQNDTVVEATTTTAPRRTSIAGVARKDFVETTEIEGTLGFGTIEQLPNLAAGVITWIPEAGTVIEVGDTLYEVDNVPVVYLPGDIPAYRAMDSSRNTTDGDDVLQLEEFLDSLGLMEPLNASVDGDFTSYTGDAVEDWYEQYYKREGIDSVRKGFVMFGRDSFRISSVNVSLGQQINGGSVLSITNTTRLVSVALDTGLTGILEVDDVVQVELPDESIVSATVTDVSTVAVTQGQGQQATSFLPVELILDGDGSLFDESPVTIFVEEAIELEATVIPISALLALAEGGYAVEVMREGQPVLTGVRLSNFLNNEVSVEGDLEPGDEVVVPS